jgi:hypothetical protein
MCVRPGFVANDRRYSLWELITAVVLAAVFFGWAQFVFKSYNLTPFQLLIGPILFGELVSLAIFRWARAGDAAAGRSFLIFVSLLSLLTLVGMLLKW